MSGQEAIRGFEYQFLRTLEYAFEAIEDRTSLAILLATRPAKGEFGDLCAVLDDRHATDLQFQGSLTALVRRSKYVTERIGLLDEEGWRRLRRCRVELDARPVSEIRYHMRETVRRLRRRFCTGPPGWDAAGRRSETSIQYRRAIRGRWSVQCCLPWVEWPLALELERI